MSLSTIKTKSPADLDGFQIEFPDGLNVRICRVPLDTDNEQGPSQLSVFINTEAMDDIDHDNDEPEMQVLLNDGSLYDREPGSGFDAVEKKRKEEEQLALWFTPQCIREHFDGAESETEEWVDAAPNDVLKMVGQACLADDNLYSTFHEVLVDSIADAQAGRL